jgi:hypothetical protein
MKMVKSLLLGSAAGLVAVAGAQAADLPVKAKPVQYVKICSLYGVGYYYIPGTDTCLKVGGFVRAEMNFNANNSFAVAFGNHDSRSYNFENTRARFVATFDARSQTEYGTLRSYFQLGEQVSNDEGVAIDTGGVNAGFIQIAGFTAGLGQSFFDFWNNAVYSNISTYLNSSIGGTGTLVFGYTAQFGNGFSASIAAEDTSARRQSIYTQTYAGRQWPDAVANLRVDQAWGSAQVSGALHQVRGLTSGEEVGWATGAGVTLNLPWAKGDSFTAAVNYAVGAIDYAGHGFTTTSVSQDGTDVAYLNAYDAVTLADGSLELTTAWSVIAGIRHNWNAKWQTSLYGGYGEVLYSDSANAVLNGTTGNADYGFWQIGSRTVWTPVQNLALSVDLLYNNVQTATAQNGVDRLTASDVGWFSGMFRLQRDFWP